MSQEALVKAIERASTDAAWRTQLQTNPEAALAGYDLTADERAALMQGEQAESGAMGVDQRVSKMTDSFGIDTAGGFS